MLIKTDAPGRTLVTTAEFLGIPPFDSLTPVGATVLSNPSKLSHRDRPTGLAGWRDLVRLCEKSGLVASCYLLIAALDLAGADY
jgi:hypothetical protein